jgi:hypothetical protein
LAIAHACFISYCHAEKELMSRFVTELVSALESSLEPYMDLKVCIDADRLKPGYLYNEALAEDICRSLCMVSVFVPKYLDHEYCRREIEAMQQVEDRRREAGFLARTHGCLIPVVLRGDIAELPDAIKGRVHSCDFSKFTTATRRIGRQREFARQIDEIAKFINELRRSCASDAHDCASAAMPTAAQADRWKPAVPTKPMLPLREAGR